MRRSKLSDWIIVLCQFLLVGSVMFSAYYENILIHRLLSSSVSILSIIMLGIGSAGLIASVIAFRQKITPLPVPRKDARLIRSGIYSIIRHPMYFSLIMMTVGYCLYFGAFYSLGLCLLLFLFFDYKTRREERYLKERFPEYLEYSNKTKKLIPYIY